MTLPQDTRSPHRQQRWIELYNASAETIPPFAALEIVSPGSERPEQGSNYTPGDGRTVLYVRRATRDNPCATVINGPCEIPMYQYGRVGTMDDPMLALVANASYQTGTVVGVKSGSFFLEEGYCGYLIIGDYDSGTVTMRVKRWEDCNTELMVKAYECILPGDMDGIAIPQRWNGAQRCWEDDPNADRIKVCDCNKWLLAVPGECFKVERTNSCETSGSNYGQACYRPSFPYGLTRRVRIKEPIPPDACGNATILKPSAANPCYMEETDCEIRVCNGAKRKVGCDANEDVTLHIQPGECGTGTPPECYGWIDPGPRALIAKIIGGQVCGAEMEIESIEYIDVTDWLPREQPKIAKNPMGIYNCAGLPVYAVWNDESCGWDLLQPTYHRIGKVMLDMGCSEGDCGIDKEKTMSDVVVQQCEQCGQTNREQAIAGEMVDFVKEVDLSCSSGCSPSIQYGKACVMCSDGSSPKGNKPLPTVEGYMLTGFGPYSRDEDDDNVFEQCGLQAFKSRVCFIGCAESADNDFVNFERIEMATEVAFSCDPCPAFDWDKGAIWGLCKEVGAAQSPAECECAPCEASSASATPSGA